MMLNRCDMSPHNRKMFMVTFLLAWYTKMEIVACTVTTTSRFGGNSNATCNGRRASTKMTLVGRNLNHLIYSTILGRIWNLILTSFELSGNMAVLFTSMRWKIFGQRQLLLYDGGGCYKFNFLTSTRVNLSRQPIFTVNNLCQEMSLLKGCGRGLRCP